MRLLVFQHIDCEHPGRLREHLASDGTDWRAVELDAGEPIPPLEAYDALYLFLDLAHAVGEGFGLFRRPWVHPLEAGGGAPAARIVRTTR